MMMQRLRRFAADRPFLFALGCMVVYAVYIVAGQTAKRLDATWGVVGAELLAGLLGTAVLAGLGWWRQVDLAAPRWRSLWVIIPFLLFVVSGYRGVTTSALATLGFAGRALLIGYQEEVWLRGIFLETFRPRYGAFGGVVCSSLLFGLFHFAHLLSGAALADVVLQVLATLLFGLVYAGLRLRTGSLWVAVVLHGAVDFFSFVGTSAGEGLEPASPVVLLVMAGVILAYGVALLWGVGRGGARGAGRAA